MPNWREMFGVDVPILESVLRGVVVYAGLFVLMRLVARREAGSISLSDLLLVNLVAEAVSNGLQGENKSIPSSLITAATTLACAYGVDWLSYRWRWFGRFTDPLPKALVRDGALRPRALEEELITRDELEAQARLNGVESLRQVKHATMEGDGRISVVAKDKEEAAPPPRRKKRRRLPREEALQRLWALQRKLEAQHARIEATLQEMMLEPKR